MVSKEIPVDCPIEYPVSVTIDLLGLLTACFTPRPRGLISKKRSTLTSLDADFGTSDWVGLIDTKSESHRHHPQVQKEQLDG